MGLVISASQVEATHPPRFTRARWGWWGVGSGHPPPWGNKVGEKARVGGQAKPIYPRGFTPTGKAGRLDQSAKN